MSMTSETTVIAKLLLKPGNTVLIIDAPKNYEEIVGHLPPDARIVTDEGELPADLVLLFATSKQELVDQLPRAIAGVRPEGLLWIAYPKVSTGTFDISRGVVHDALRANKWRPVTQIAMDDVWTALRARPVAGG